MLFPISIFIASGGTASSRPKASWIGSMMLAKDPTCLKAGREKVTSYSKNDRCTVAFISGASGHTPRTGCSASAFTDASRGVNNDTTHGARPITRVHSDRQAGSDRGQGVKLSPFSRIVAVQSGSEPGRCYTASAAVSRRMGPRSLFHRAIVGRCPHVQGHDPLSRLRIVMLVPSGRCHDPFCSRWQCNPACAGPAGPPPSELSWHAHPAVRISDKSRG